VRVRVTASCANYLRSLPLHHSQIEIEQENDHSIFEFFVAPTYDFIQELRSQGDELLVQKPKWLAMKFRELGWKYTLMYPKEEKQQHTAYLGVKTCLGWHVDSERQP